MKLVRMMEKASNLCMGLIFLSGLVSSVLTFVVFRLDGEYAWSEIPIPVRCSMLAAGFFLAATLVLLMGSMVVRSLVNRSVLSKGQPAMAQILQVSDTGTAINDNPIARILLEVYPPDQAPFQAEAEQLISRFQIPQVQPGVFVQVKYDPDSHAVVIVPDMPHKISHLSLR